MSTLTVHVNYGSHKASFSCRAHAFEFARYISRMSGYASEVRARDGLIGQFNDQGEPSPEFPVEFAPANVGERALPEAAQRIADAFPTRAAAPKDPTGPGRTVHKFRLVVGERDAYIRGEGLTRIVHFGMQNGKPHCWAEVHPGEPMIERRVQIVGTGHPVPAGMVHQGALFDDAFVWHLYAGSTYAGLVKDGPVL